MRTGRQTLASIDETIARLHNEEQRLDGLLKSAADDAERFRIERAGALRELARVKLGEIAAGRLVRDLDAAERRAVDVLDDRRNRIAALAERREAAVRDLEAATADRHAAAAAVEAALEIVEQRRAEAEASVQATPAWKAAKGRFDDADHIVAEAERKATQSETELGAKKKPYDDDPLFIYLWRANYGTGRYAAGNLARMIDSLVAEFVGYSDARANYAMLSEIPVRLREHATGRRASADEAKTDLAALEREAMVGAGIEKDERALAAARHKLAAAEATLDGRRKLLADIEQQREAMLSGTGDPAYAEALQTIAAADSRDDIATLFREARRTETAADETLVRKIDEIDRSAERAEQDKSELRRTAKTLAQRRIEVETTRERFRSAGYDHPHATFGNDTDIGRVLGQILEGAVRSGVLWDVIRGGFSTRTPRGRPDFGTPSFPFPFPIPGGGSNGPSGGGWREPESRGGWFPPKDSGSGGGGDSGSRSDDGDFSTGGTF